MDAIAGALGGVGDFGTGFLDTISQKAGNIEKAYIEIYDRKAKDPQHDAAVKSSGSYGWGSFSTSGLDLPDPGKLGSMDTEFAEGKILNGEDPFSEENSLEGKIFGGTSRFLEVQFNPSDIVVSGMGGGRSLQQNFTDKDKDGGNKYTSMPVYATMSVKLIFDSMDRKDAFYADKMLSSYTELGRSAVKLAKNIFSSGEGDGGVQGKVEGFIGAIRSNGSCPIRFYWGKYVCYEGILQSVSGQYTMFDMYGRPIRAAVTITIVLMDENRKKGPGGDSGVEAWREKYYEAAFGKAGAAGSLGYSLADHGNKYFKL